MPHSFSCSLQSSSVGSPGRTSRKHTQLFGIILGDLGRRPNTAEQGMQLLGLSLSQLDLAPVHALLWQKAGGRDGLRSLGIAIPQDRRNDRRRLHQRRPRLGQVPAHPSGALRPRSHRTTLEYLGPSSEWQPSTCSTAIQHCCSPHLVLFLWCARLVRVPPASPTLPW